MTARTDRRTAECDHPAEAGCYHCCSLCNYDRHICPGCGENVPHGQIACSACSAPAVPMSAGIERFQCTCLGAEKIHAPGALGCIVTQPAPVAQTSPLAAPPARSIDLDGTTAASWYEALRMADAEIARQQAVRERAIEHLQEAMGDATEARIGGQTVITWRPSKPGMSLDRAALEARYGKDVIAQFMKERKAARPFKVTGGEA